MKLVLPISLVAIFVLALAAPALAAQPASPGGWGRDDVAVVAQNPELLGVPNLGSFVSGAAQAPDGHPGVSDEILAEHMTSGHGKFH